jgi:hypothetical protein
MLIHSGLSVHLNQVHKEQLSYVENALPNRQGLEVEIFAMEGIPDDIIAAHNQRVLQQFYEAQAERRAKSGNLAPGEPAKRRKIVIETPEDLLSRFSEWKVRKSDPNWNPMQDIQMIPQPVQQPYQPHIPVQSYAQPPVQSTYPGAPQGLPQRPVFGQPAAAPQFGALPGTIDDLIASVSTVPEPEKKSAKKEKDKNSRMAYSDNNISPEEKMATLSRYAFVR